jgi:hypothetical protein
MGCAQSGNVDLLDAAVHPLMWASPLQVWGACGACFSTFSRGGPGQHVTATGGRSMVLQRLQWLRTDMAAYAGSLTLHTSHIGDII